MYPRSPMSTMAPTRPAALVALALGVLAAGVLAVWEPAVGIGIAILALAVALIRAVPMPRVAQVAVVITAVAAIAGPNLAAPGAPYLFAFRVLIVVLGLALVAYLLMDGRVVLPAALPLPAGLLCVWVLWSALSMLWAEDVLAALRWTAFLAMMAGLAIALALVCRTRRRAVILLVVLGVTFVVAFAAAMVELVLGLRLPTSALLNQSRDTAFAATSLFGNQNNFATYLTLTLPYFLTLPVIFRDVRIKAIGFVGAAAALVGLLYTGSKSNLIAMGLILVGLLVVLAFDRRGRGRLLVGIAVAALAVLLVVPSVLGGGVIKLPQRAVTKFDFGILSAQVADRTGSGAVRSSLLGEGLDLVWQTGGLGVGAGNAEVRVRSIQQSPTVANLHDWWLEVLVDGGLVGFALYLGFFLTLLRGQLGAVRRARDDLVRYLGLAGALAMIGYIAGSLGPSTAIHFAPMWITFGLCMITMVLARREREGRLR
jgi:O-antigen ligase